MKIIYSICVLLLLQACNSGEPPTTAAPVDSATSGQVNVDSAGAPSVSDTVQTFNPQKAIFPEKNGSKPANATLGFSYYPVIPQNETRDLRVFVKIDGKPETVTKTIRKIENEDLEFTKINDSSVICIIKNIEAYKKLSIKPLYDYDDFKITKVDDADPLAQADPNEQVLDFVRGNYWHWKVKAIAKTAHVGNITLLIKAETPEGERLKLAERQINIKIDINEPQLTMWEKLYNFFDAHFKEILSLVLIPVALYLFNVIRKKIRRKNDPAP